MRVRLLVAALLVMLLAAVMGKVDMQEQGYLDQISLDRLDPVAEAAPAVSNRPSVTTTTGAVRLPESVTVKATPDRGKFIPDPALPPGLFGLPVAPLNLSGCDEMEFYRVQWNLPPIFTGMGWRESNCRNDVENSCCHGYWQLHERYWSVIPECDVWDIYDLQGTDPLSKQRNACAAAHVYAISGCGAWTTCPY